MHNTTLFTFSYINVLYNEQQLLLITEYPHTYSMMESRGGFASTDRSFVHNCTPANWCWMFSLITFYKCNTRGYIDESTLLGAGVRQEMECVSLVPRHAQLSVACSTEKRAMISWAGHRNDDRSVSYLIWFAMSHMWPLKVKIPGVIQWRFQTRPSPGIAWVKFWSIVVTAFGRRLLW